MKNADSKRAPDTCPIIGAAMEVYRIALGESTWRLRGSITKDWSIQRTSCANLRHLRLTFSRKEKPNERPRPLRHTKHRQAAEKRAIFRHALLTHPSLLLPTTALASFQGFLPGLTIPVFKGKK